MSTESRTEFIEPDDAEVKGFPETQPREIPTEATFVAWQEPNPVTAEHIREIEARTATMTPKPVTTPETEAEIADRAAFEDWKRDRDGRSAE